MRTEDVLRRDAEYRAVREALGTYDVVLVLAQPCAEDPLESRLLYARVPDRSARPAGLDFPRWPGASRIEARSHR